MKSKEDTLKDIDMNKLYANANDYGYCGISIKVKCIDCPFSRRYNKQPCRDTILQYIKYVKKRKIKEILK